MLAASSDLPFPLVTVCLFFISGCSPLPTTLRATGTNPMRPLRPRGFSSEALVLSTEDYDRPEDTVSTISPSSVSPRETIHQRCNYNPCVEGHSSCLAMGASTGCLCPGFALRDTAPGAPSLKSVSWNGSEVVIQWCAPYSHVTVYVVTVGGQEWQTFGNKQRSGALGDIEHMAEVCVVAVNDSGASDGSCVMYRPTDSSLPLTAGLIGGALGFLLLLLLAVLLWRHRRQRKQEASISMRNTAETQ